MNKTHTAEDRGGPTNNETRWFCEYVETDNCRDTNYLTSFSKTVRWLQGSIVSKRANAALIYTLTSETCCIDHISQPSMSFVHRRRYNSNLGGQKVAKLNNYRCHGGQIPGAAGQISLLRTSVVILSHSYRLDAEGLVGVRKFQPRRGRPGQFNTHLKPADTHIHRIPARFLHSLCCNTQDTRVG